MSEYGYIRVSSIDQNDERQMVEMRKLGIAEKQIYKDKQSGKDFNRKEYIRLKSLLRPDDELIIKELDRLGRNKEEIKAELREFKERKVIVRILNVPTTLIDYQGQEWIFDMVNNILIEVLGTIAEQERQTIRKRQREGIDAAKAKGKHLGRPKLELPDNYDEVINLWQNNEITARQAMKMLCVSKSVFYRWVKN